MDLPYKNYKDILLKILEIIGYTDDKDLFIKQFTETVYNQTTNDLIQSLPENDQLKIKQDISEVKNNIDKIEEVMSQYFTEDQRVKAFQNSAENFIKDYFEAIDEALTIAQKQKLADFFQSLQSPPLIS